MSLNVSIKAQHPTPYGLSDREGQLITETSPPAWPRDCPTAQPDTMADNNTCTP